MAWADRPHNKCIFWLNGMAGTGKSTIARTVARRFADQKRLGASFFFFRGGGDLSLASKFFCTLASQLADFSPDLKHYIGQTRLEHTGIAQKAMQDQWRQLIFLPLKKLKASQLQSSTVVMVIDALDECESQRDVELILQLLVEAKDLANIQLRIFITSRPENYLQSLNMALEDTICQRLTLHDIDESTVRHDISVFFRDELEKLKRRKRWLPSDWPGKETIELLTRRAGGLFIYAATVCRFIGYERYPEEEPLSQMQRRLDLILQGGSPGGSSIQELNEIYLQIIRQSSLQDHDEKVRHSWNECFRLAVGSVIILFDPLSAKALSKLCFKSVETIYESLEALSAVLEIPESPDSPIRLFHPSFRDFLLDQRRCSDAQFWIDERRTHHDLFMRCLKVMSEHLRRDMCNLQMPGVLISELKNSKVEYYPPSDVQYACRYWVDHLRQGNIDPCDYGQIHIFLREHFLHWLEALSLMGKMSEAIFMMTTLQSMLTVSGLVLLCYDPRR
jgi:hypothetical protein